MIILAGTNETNRAAESMNFQKQWELRIVEPTKDKIMRAVEGSDDVTHVIIDMDAIKVNEALALDLIERIRTITRIEVLVIAQGFDRSSMLYRNLVGTGIGEDHICTEDIVGVKRWLGRMLPRDSFAARKKLAEEKEAKEREEREARIREEVIKRMEEEEAARKADEEYEKSLDDALEYEAAHDAKHSDLIDLSDEASVVSLDNPAPDEVDHYYERKVDATIVPPSQIERKTAQQNLVFKMPTIPRDNCITIAVTGASPRVGTTTQAVQIMLYLISQQRKACLIEMHNNPCLETYLSALPDSDVEIVDEGHFQIKGFDIYHDPKKYAEAKSKNDFIVLDYGVYGDIADPTSYLDKDIKIVVAGVKPWESQFLEPIFSFDDGSMEYIFSFVPQREQKIVLQQMRDSSNQTFFAPYCPDLLTFCGDDVLYRKVSKLAGDIVQKKPGFIDRIKGAVKRG